jgi:ADP-heptose:LPS heptosyltransferase
MSLGGALIDHGVQTFARWYTPKGARPTRLRNARRFLFLQYEIALGTAVHATPVYDALRKAVPDAHIAVLSNGIPFEVLKYNPNIDNLSQTPHPFKNWLASLRFFAAKVRRQRAAFDCVILDSGNRRFRLHVLALLSGVPLRLGFKIPRNFNHASLNYDPDQSVSRNNLRLLDLLGHPCDPTEPAVYYSRAEVDRVQQLLERQGVSLNKPLVAFQTQTSGGEPNQWFDDRFIALADTLHHKTGVQTVFLGAKSEISRVQMLRSRLRTHSFSVAGCTDIPGLAALLSACDLLVTLDTGTMHVGRAVKVPMVVLAPGKNPEHEWLPPAAEHIRVIRHANTDCLPCRTTTCSTRECMKRIQVPEVLEATLLHLQKFPRSNAARHSRVSQALSSCGSRESSLEN